MLQQHSQHRDIVPLRCLVDWRCTLYVRKTGIGSSFEEGDNIGQVAVLAGNCHWGESSPGSVVDVGAQGKQDEKGFMVTPSCCIRQSRVPCDGVLTVDVSSMLNQHLADLTMTLSSCPVQVIVAVRSGQSYASPSAKQVPHHLSFAKQGSKAEGASSTHDHLINVRAIVQQSVKNLGAVCLATGKVQGAEDHVLAIKADGPCSYC